MNLRHILHSALSFKPVDDVGISIGSTRNDYNHLLSINSNLGHTKFFHYIISRPKLDKNAYRRVSSQCHKFGEVNLEQW